MGLDNQPPAWLSDTAQAKWHELLDSHPELASKADTLAMLCDAWATYLRAAQDVCNMGVVIRAGERVWNNPAVNTKEQERKSVIKLSKLLGLIKDGDDEDDDTPSPLRALIENR